MRLLIALILILFCFMEWGGPRRGKEMGKYLVGQEIRAHTFVDYICCLIWVWLVVPQNNYNSNINDY